MWYQLAYARLPLDWARVELAQSRNVINQKLVQEIEFSSKDEYVEAILLHIGPVDERSMALFISAYKTLAGSTARF